MLIGQTLLEIDSGDLDTRTILDRYADFPESVRYNTLAKVLRQYAATESVMVDKWLSSTSKLDGDERKIIRSLVDNNNEPFPMYYSVY